MTLIPDDRAAREVEAWEAAALSRRVDVVILSWERVDDTLAAVASVLAQEDVAVTAIVVDQGSSEATLARLREALAGRPDVVLEEIGHNVGVPEGRNRARRLASANIVVALDNDAEFADPRCSPVSWTGSRAIRRWPRWGFASWMRPPAATTSPPGAIPGPRSR